MCWKLTISYRCRKAVKINMPIGNFSIVIVTTKNRPEITWLIAVLMTRANRLRSRMPRKWHVRF